MAEISLNYYTQFSESCESWVIKKLQFIYMTLLQLAAQYMQLSKLKRLA